jgi:hypothetical protein
VAEGSRCDLLHGGRSPEPDLSMVYKLDDFNYLQDFQADSSMASGEVGRVLEQTWPGQWVKQPSCVRQQSPLRESWCHTLNIEMDDSPTSPKHHPNTACCPTAETPAPVAAGQDTTAGHKRKNDSQNIGARGPTDE